MEKFSHLLIRDLWFGIHWNCYSSVQTQIKIHVGMSKNHSTIIIKLLNREIDFSLLRTCIWLPQIHIPTNIHNTYITAFTFCNSEIIKQALPKALREVLLRNCLLNYTYSDNRNRLTQRWYGRIKAYNFHQVEQMTKLSLPVKDRLC